MSHKRFGYTIPLSFLKEIIVAPISALYSKPVLEKFSQMDEVVGQKVSKKDFKDGVKLYLEDNTTWILVRPSGTEPLLRIYIESDSQNKIDEIVNFVK